MNVTYNQTSIDGEALGITSITIKSSYVPRDGELVVLNLLCGGQEARMNGRVKDVWWDITGETNVTVFLVG